VELLVDFDHYRNTATERFSMRMFVSIGIEHSLRLYIAPDYIAPDRRRSCVT
jgi:hypothetical protein